MHWCISKPPGNAKSQKKFCDRSTSGQRRVLQSLLCPQQGSLAQLHGGLPLITPHILSMLPTPPMSLPPHTLPAGAPHDPHSDPQLPSSSPWHLPPSLSAREVPCSAQLWSPGTTRSLGPTETSRMGRRGKESSFKGLKIRQGL